MRIEKVPDIPMFRENTAAFVRELLASAISDVNGESRHVRIQVLTNAGALNRDKQLAVVEQLNDPSRSSGRSNPRKGARGCCSPRPSRAAGACGATPTNEELVTAARDEVASLRGA